MKSNCPNNSAPVGKIRNVYTDASVKDINKKQRALP